MDLRNRRLSTDKPSHTLKHSSHAREQLSRALGLWLVLGLVAACSDPGHVVVLTEETTAQVWVDGVQTGEIGPDGFEVECGPHTIEVKAEGYQPWSKEIEVTSERSSVLQVELLGLAAFLVVRSNVSGDTVWIDDTPVGSSGPHSHEIPPGPHVVRVERPGYSPFLLEVNLEPNETHTVQATLYGDPTLAPGVVPVPVPGYAPRPWYGVPGPRRPRFP